MIRESDKVRFPNVTVGVESDVSLSLSFAPKSLDAIKSGVFGVFGTDVSMLKLIISEEIETLPAGS